MRGGVASRCMSCTAQHRQSTACQSRVWGKRGGGGHQGELDNGCIPPRPFVFPRKRKPEPTHRHQRKLARFGQANKPPFNDRRVQEARQEGGGGGNASSIRSMQASKTRTECFRRMHPSCSILLSPRHRHLCHLHLLLCDGTSLQSWMEDDTCVCLR